MKYRKRTQKLKRYARAFCDQIRKDYPRIDRALQLKGIKRPVVRCYRFGVSTKGTFKNAVYTAEGHMLINGYYNETNKEIEIFHVTKEKPEELRCTVRHECIHFILESCGLPFRDWDDLFLVLALKYDARPYELFGRREDLRELIDNYT